MARSTQQGKHGSVHRSLLAFDWKASGFYPWRIPALMIMGGIIGFFLFSMIDVRFENTSFHDRYPESVLFLERTQLERMVPDSRLLVLGSQGPVWADPVRSGIESELFFPLDAGLGRESEMMTLTGRISLRNREMFINYLDLPPARVDEWLAPQGATPSMVFVPVVAPWTENLAGSWFAQGRPEEDVDRRGLKTTCWVRVNEWGAPESVTLMETSGNEQADQKALGLVRQLRWLPAAGRREGMISIDWKGRSVP